MPSVRYARPGGPPRMVQPAGSLPEKAGGGGASAGTTTALASPSMCRTRRREVREGTWTARRVAPAREKRPGRAPPSRSTAEGNLASLTRLAGTDLPTGHRRCPSAESYGTRSCWSMPIRARVVRAAPTRSPAAATPVTPTTDIVCITSGCCTQSCPRTRLCPRGWQPQGGHCVSGADDEHTKYVFYEARGVLPGPEGAGVPRSSPAPVDVAVANLRGVSFTQLCSQ